MEAVVKQLRNDAQLGVFLSPDCSVSAIASEVVAKDSAASKKSSKGETEPLQRGRGVSFSGAGAGDVASHSERFIQRIDQAVHQIDRVITEHISEHHMSLLDQVGSVDALQEDVASIQASVEHVKRAVDDLEAKVRSQHDRLQRDIHKHRNVEACGDLVRRLLRFHQLHERVTESSVTLVNGASHAASGHRSHEMSSTAMAIREIESLLSDPQFEELSIVRDALPAIRRTSGALRKDVRNQLKDGVQRLSQADAAEALKILFYLGSLSDAVQSTVNEIIQGVERKCGAVIAEDMLLSRGGPNGSEVTVQKADVWKAVQDVFECIRAHALQVWNLQRVLAKMVDPGTGRNYLEMVIENDEPTLFATFWEVSCAILRELFSSTLSFHAAVKTVLIASYPRMREEATRMLNELHAATQRRDFDVASDATLTERQRDGLRAVAASAVERNQLLDSMAPLADAFMERSFRRISNPIQMMFPQSSNFHTSPPSRSDMQTLARTFFGELEQVGSDPVLIDRMILQVHKAVELFCVNAKKIMNTGQAATAVTASFGRSAGQAHNVALLSALHQMDEMVGEIAGRLAMLASQQSASTRSGAQQSIKAVSERELTPCREQIQALEYFILGQYLRALAQLAERIFAKMHEESFADRARDNRPNSATPPGSTSSASSAGSKYMTEFTAAFGVLVEDHIRRLPATPIVSTCVSAFVSRLVSVFIRHASLLRPLEENGKLRLANDMAQLELRLESVLPLRTLGACYDELRAFRHMIFLDSASTVRDAVIDKIRPSNVWHHLISRAPLELQHPHQMKRMTASKYIEWLDTAACFQDAESARAVVEKLPLGYPCLQDSRLSVAAEKEAWKEITKCLEAYVQRASAVPGAELDPVYELLQESGAILLAGYELNATK
ncbi:hypothetical protein ATCC90586_009604 [Pythium insidiosum]|nr:hypothetical protein ATCC90586_009604 [Pythium insidiosum]